MNTPNIPSKSAKRSASFNVSSWHTSARCFVRDILASASLSIQLLHMHAQAMIHKRPVNVESKRSISIFPCEPSAKPIVAVIKLPRRIPGLVSEK